MRFSFANDETAGIYVALIGGAPAAGLTYSVVGESRLLLLATSVFPAFRRRGIADELIRSVVDELMARALDEIAAGKTVTVLCPVAGEFIARNPRYLDLVDQVHPGSGRTAHGTL